MDSPDDCRAIAFDNKYRFLYGCDPQEEVYEDEDGEPLEEDEIRAIKREREHKVRRALGWN